MYKFLKENWFKILIVLIFFWVALNFHKIVNNGLNVDVNLCKGGLGIGRLIPGSIPSFCK